MLNTKLAVNLDLTLILINCQSVGQNYGAKKYERIRQGVRITGLMIILCGAVMFALMYLFGSDLAELFVTDSADEVGKVAAIWFRTVSWFYPALGMIFVFRNAIQGLGEGFIPMLGGVFELTARALIVIVIGNRFGFQGICLSEPAAWIAALIPLVPYYFIKMNKLKHR